MYRKMLMPTPSSFDWSRSIHYPLNETDIQNHVLSTGMWDTPCSILELRLSQSLHCRWERQTPKRSLSPMYWEISVLIPASFDRFQHHTCLGNTRYREYVSLRYWRLSINVFKSFYSSQYHAYSWDIDTLNDACPHSTGGSLHAIISSLRLIVSICLPQSYKSLTTRISQAIETLWGDVSLLQPC
jgi:hypothetical protein